MKIIKSVAEMSSLGKAWKSQGQKVGLVPTMGYLHKGHLSLVKASVENNDLTVVSVFVNPIQFGVNEDFGEYPRDLTGDVEAAASVGADYVFAPEAYDMYPKGFATTMDIAGVTENLCGLSRPGHFQGVGVVVTKLFNLVQPDNAYFGQKDGQQVAVIKGIVRDLNIPVNIQVMPIVREADGLALSSRNVYLNGEARAQALVLSQSLQLAKEQFQSGVRNPAEIVAQVQAHISTAPLAEIEYVEIVDTVGIQPVTEITGPVMLAMAVRFNNTRLIDNIILE